MIAEVKKAWGAIQATRGSNPHNLLLMQGPMGCNRACTYCNDRDYRDGWKAEETSGVEESCQQIYREYEQGYRALNLAGGETLAMWSRFTTKDGITYADHNERLVEYAHGLGMYTSITTNGDPLAPKNFDILKRLKRAGLDMLIVSGHDDDEASLMDYMGKARAIAQAGIIPVFSKVFTADKTEAIPDIAKTCAENGILFNTTIVQDVDETQIPTPRQQRKVFDSLLPYKRAGFVLNNLRYLTEAPNYPNNSWKCNPEKDPFVHIRTTGEKGEVGVCSGVSTGLPAGRKVLKSKEWREKKRELVKNCKGCLYSCTYESENTDFAGDIPTLAVMASIKSGHADLAQRWGKIVVALTPEIIPNPVEMAKRYLGSLVDRATGKAAWKDAMQQSIEGEWNYGGAAGHTVLALLAPLASKFFSATNLRFRAEHISLLGFPAFVADYALLSYVILGLDISPMERIGLKLAINAASHIAWDIASVAVDKIRNLRSSETTVAV